MNDETEMQRQMLADVIARAKKLVESLHKTREEVEASPPAIPPEQLQQGREAMNMAIKSAEGMLQSLQSAAEEHALMQSNAAERLN